MSWTDNVIDFCVSLIFHILNKQLFILIYSAVSSDASGEAVASGNRFTTFCNVSPPHKSNSPWRPETFRRLRAHKFLWKAVGISGIVSSERGCAIAGGLVISQPHKYCSQLLCGNRHIPGRPRALELQSGVGIVIMSQNHRSLIYLGMLFTTPYNLQVHWLYW